MEAYILKNQEYLKVRNILKDWEDAKWENLNLGEFRKSILKFILPVFQDIPDF